MFLTLHGIAERVHIDIDGLSRSEQQKISTLVVKVNALEGPQMSNVNVAVWVRVSISCSMSQTLLQQSIHDQIHTFDKSLASGGIMKHYGRLSCCELWVGK